MQKNTTELHGAFLITKPEGKTSHDIVAQLRRLPALRGVKIGHSGTLDPFATGLLLILIGHATRLQDALHELPKTYRATITLGATSDTDDSTGSITQTQAMQPSNQDVLACVKQFEGKQLQQPPIYAAIKSAGKKLYEYARKGESIHTDPRPVIIYGITVEHYSYPNIRIIVTCSTGTYIRALARDIGKSLGTGAYCSSLTREAIGTFTTQKFTKIEDIATSPKEHIIPMRTLVQHIHPIILSPGNVAKLQNGGEVRGVSHLPKNNKIALLSDKNSFVGMGMYNPETQSLRPQRMLPF